MRGAPQHVNQFRALGRFPNGSSSAPYDCMVAAAVMDLDAATGGRIRLTTTQARARQDDQNRDGIGLSDVATIHKRTQSAPGFDHGRKSWLAIRARLVAGDGAIIGGRYLALGEWRASSFTGPHAMYVQRINRPLPGRKDETATVNDPLRAGPTDIPVSALQRFYVSGLAGAGWSTGSGGAVSSGPSAPFIDIPAGKIITVADVDYIIGRFMSAGFFDGPAGAIASATFRGILMRDALGKPWDKALQDKLAGAAYSAADSSADPFGIASAVDGLVGGISEIARNGILLVAILGLVLMGLWLVATAGDGLKVPRPPIAIGA